MAAILSRDKCSKFHNPNFLLCELPKPLYGITLRTIIPQQSLKKLCEESKLDNNYCCWACGVNVNDAKYHKRLESAPIYEVNYGDKVAQLMGISSLCYLCNCYRDLRNFETLSMKFPRFKKILEDVIKHGSSLVPIETKLKLMDVNLSINDFKNWRYVYKGVKYFPILKSEEDWNEYYQQPKGN